MSEKKERWGIAVDGIKMPGFNSEKEANDYINEKNLSKKGAIAFRYADPTEEQPCCQPA
ncbi:MAG: hypothetical protein V1892_01120 [bacterium]